MHYRVLASSSHAAIFLLSTRNDCIDVMILTRLEETDVVTSTTSAAVETVGSVKIVLVVDVVRVSEKDPFGVTIFLFFLSRICRSCACSAGGDVVGGVGAVLFLATHSSKSLMESHGFCRISSCIRVFSSMYSSDDTLLTVKRHLSIP